MALAVQDLKDLLTDLAQLMSEQRDYLCKLDGEIGDADHGIAMDQGMAAAAFATKGLDDGTMQEMFNAAAKGFLNAVGASTGPLYATGFMWAGKRLATVSEVEQDDLRQVIIGMAEGIAHRGKAEPGQKTMLDAWHPAAEAAAAGANPSEIAHAAKQGAEATRGLTATLGRAARLGDRSLGHLDPGAVSAAMIVERICDRM